jgi:hypothetical protein
MSKRLHVKYLLFLSDFNQTLIFPDRFSKKSQISNLIKIRPVSAKLFHTDVRTAEYMDRHNEAYSCFSLGERV